LLPLGGMFRFAHAGVDFFFVLSGFIIFFVHRNELGNPARLPDYLARRFVRIYPTYWVILIMFGLILAVSPTSDLYERNASAVVTSALLLPSSHEPILRVAWTLQHEILFYALFSVLFLSRTLGKAVLGTWAALIITNMLTGCFPIFPGKFLFETFNIEFFFGMGVAVLLQRLRISWPRALLTAGATLFFAIGLMESWGPKFPNAWLPHILYASGAAMALYGMVGAEQTGRIKQIPRMAVALGTASYSIYLFHTVVVLFLRRAVMMAQHYVDLPIDLTFIVVVVATVIVCERFSHYVEQPLLRWSRRAITRRRPVSA
jgi:peptidoglycan/LPS O-acetylase OafA/YrhL